MRLKLTAGLCMVLIFSFFGCAKRTAKRLEGIYECTVFDRHYLMGEYSDTTFEYDLEILSEDGVLQVKVWDEFLVPVKSLDKNDCFYSGGSSGWQEICFSNNSVVFSEGHQWHNSDWLRTYTGTKKH